MTQSVNRVPLPPHYNAILARSQDLQFTMNSDVLTGSLLRALAAMRPGGRLLELGTGCGLGTTWLLDGMDAQATLVSVDTDERFQGVAWSILGHDSRVSFHLEDGAEFLSLAQEPFDLIYADAWPGKFSHLDEALALLAPGGTYVIDDLLPQPNWPAGHGSNVEALVQRLSTLNGFEWTWLEWSTGVGLLVRK